VLEIGLALDANMLAVEYPGYWNHFGRGISTADEIKSESKIILDFVLEDMKIPISQVIVLGQSMGTGVACNLVSQMTTPCCALILFSPYYSITEAIGGLRFGLKFGRHFVKNHFDSATLIKKVKSPILIIHGEKDPLIPIA